MPPRQPLKLLLLHGYTQSGPLFHAKSRALIKHLTKAFPLHDLAAIYPTAPIRLNPADIPGYEPPEQQQAEENDPEAYGWYRRLDHVDPPLYAGLEDGLSVVADVLAKEGPFDGVIGFSQGAAMAAMVASLLEGGRKDAFARAQEAAAAGSTSTSSSSVVFPFPASFAALSHPPLKFAICYSGFRAPGPRYTGFYEDPKIQTPVLHVLGSLDAVVDEGRSRSLIEACAGEPEKEGKVVWHPGGHFLPSQRAYLDAAVLFVRGCLGGGKVEEKVEEDVNDMDVPF